MGHPFEDPAVVCHQPYAGRPDGSPEPPGPPSPPGSFCGWFRPCPIHDQDGEAADDEPRDLPARTLIRDDPPEETR